MLIKLLRMFFTVILFGLLLSACGESDSGSSEATSVPAASSGSESASAPAMSGSDALEDNGVVYQEEIYKNWPYQ